MASARKLGYFALVVAVACACTPETAFEKLQSDRPSLVTHPSTKQDAEDMKQLKAQGLTFPEIGRIYGITHYAVYRRMNRLA